MNAAYRIADEPTPSRLSEWSVRPFWPLLGGMLGGAWLGLAWFAFNGLAVGSPHRKREVAWAILGLVGSVVLAVGVVWSAAAFELSGRQIKLSILVLTLWKLTVYYALYNLQSRSFEIYTFYGGKTKNGAAVALLALFLRGKLVDVLPTLWTLVLL